MLVDYRYWLRRLLLWLINDTGGGMVERELGECSCSLPPLWLDIGGWHVGQITPQLPHHFGLFEVAREAWKQQHGPLTLPAGPKYCVSCAV